MIFRNDKGELAGPDILLLKFICRVMGKKCVTTGAGMASSCWNNDWESVCECNLNTNNYCNKISLT